jgi:hypothetical protein
LGAGALVLSAWTKVSNVRRALQNHIQAVQFGRIQIQETILSAPDRVTADLICLVVQHGDGTNDAFEISRECRFKTFLEERKMKSYRLAFALSVIGVAILTVGCSSNETKTAPEKEAAVTKPQKAEPTLYTGQEAFNRMLGLALKWSADAEPARVESVLTTETTGQDGKATIWRGYFASPSRRAVKTIVCSGSRRPGAPPLGVSTEGADGAYNAESAGLAFSQYLLKTDTDKAFAVAQQHGGDAIVKKDAQQPITYVLLKDRKHNVPVWYVIYGASEKDRKGIGVINATTGNFVSAGK